MRILLTLLVIACALPGNIRAKTQLANAVAVIVNDAVITYADIERYIEPSMELLYRQYGDKPQVLDEKLAAARQEGTEQLVERQLILSDWKTSGYSLPESILDDEVRERVRERFGDRLTLTKTLQAQGITFERFRQNIREDIIVGVLRNKNVSSSIIISPQKIEDYYGKNHDKFKQADQIKLRMIVLNASPSNPDGAKKLAEEIRGKIKEGSTFAEMATIYSEGSQAKSGGDWGWVERSVLRKELADVAFSLKVGELSDIVQLEKSFYLMLVEEKKASQFMTLSEVRDDIEKTLVAEERTRLQKKYIERLKTKSFIRYF